jgi:hypothetical protein
MNDSSVMLSPSSNSMPMHTILPAKAESAPLGSVGSRESVSMSNTTFRRVGVGKMRICYLQRKKATVVVAFCVELKCFSFADAALALQYRSRAVQFERLRAEREIPVEVNDE